MKYLYEKEFVAPPSLESCQRSLVEAHLCVDFSIASLLSKSISLLLAVDACQIQQYKCITNIPTKTLTDYGFGDKKEKKKIDQFKKIINSMILKTTFDANTLLLGSTNALNFFYNNSVAVQSSTLPENAPYYVNTYIDCCLEPMEKHNREFIDTASSSDNIVITGTNRKTESVFARAKYQLKKNKFTIVCCLNQFYNCKSVHHSL